MSPAIESFLCTKMSFTELHNSITRALHRVQSMHMKASDIIYILTSLSGLFFRRSRQTFFIRHFVEFSLNIERTDLPNMGKTNNNKHKKLKRNVPEGNNPSNSSKRT